MRIFGLLLAVLFGLSAQTPANPSGPQRHLEYDFSYYPTVGSGGGHGTMSVDILGRAGDGGMLVSASDWWWNAVRPRQAAQCEVYADGTTACLDAPYLLPPMQSVLFPLLARDYFSGLSRGAAAWQSKYTVERGDLLKTLATFDLKASGAGDGKTVRISSHGTLAQQDGRYRKGIAEGDIVYDLQSKVPVSVHDVRTRVPNGSVFTQDTVDLHLTKDSLAPN